ncbi:TlpA family protein disulfide reductase [Aliifodinibius salicampi]|uniref:TlpA family protein disulfide reductase n=1 Tax=Fodinibius salicampi TaxID=1920655 RepID=A0ABT3PW36_9BACT|nr:TlpA disulfide reductase family protein [Fodinibius salicampi]MCW9712058.1 TlpA family protein disulfide reductase [Fodinibius salicampi]
MKNNGLLLIISAAALLFWGCSSGDDSRQAIVKGQFSASDSMNTADNSLLPISLTIVRQDSAEADPDTLFHEETDSSGHFSGSASFREKGRYPVYISKDGNNIGRFGVILAEDDTLEITGELSNLEETLNISSREHDAMQKLGRLNNGFQRIARYANAGRLSDDSLEQELDKWSDLYFELYQENEQTRAGSLAAAEAIRLLQGWNGEKMMNRIRSVQDNDDLVYLGLNYGKDYLARSRGLQPTLAYLDTLSDLTEGTQQLKNIERERIKLLYDSARISAAQERLDEFRQQYAEDSVAMEWAESIDYDLNYLSPGDELPSFEFSSNGKTTSRDSLLGRPYILEITRLSNELYQEQFDRTVVIHSIYKNYDLEVVTIPLDESQITVDAFFDERVRAWPVADAQAFDRDELLEKFNIRLIPTRFLVDSEGEIIRKYVGREYQEVIKGIQTLLNQDQ